MHLGFNPIKILLEFDYNLVVEHFPNMYEVLLQSSESQEAIEYFIILTHTYSILCKVVPIEDYLNL